jgi:hypothetical protein
MDKYSFVYFNLYICRQQTGRKKVSELNGSKHCPNLNPLLFSFFFFFKLKSCDGRVVSLVDSIVLETSGFTTPTQDRGQKVFLLFSVYYPHLS